MTKKQYSALTIGLSYGLNKPCSSLHHSKSERHDCTQKCTAEARHQLEMDAAYNALRELNITKQALHDARLENSGQAAQLESTRPEPSRLEIAAMLKSGWFANREADFNARDHGWWLEQADALIAAAREGK